MFPTPLEGRYAIQRELGRGGHGRVFVAEDLKLGRAVAIKVLGAHLAENEEVAIQRLQREGRVASAINHPNVCAATDTGRLASGQPFLVLELLHGETLEARLAREGKLPLAVTLALGEQILLGLAAAHRLGVVHRDIKPANAFLVDLGLGREQLKLLDFGSAQVPGGPPSDGATLTRAGLVIGTIEYMAPEQVRGVRGLDPRTDVYAAGVVFYEMLSGHRPFHGLALDAMADAIGFKQPPPIASVVPLLPPPVARAIDAALSVDLKRRHADAGAFLLALRGGGTRVDEWNLPTARGARDPQAELSSSGAAAAAVGINASEWETVTHRMYAESSSEDIDVTFASTGELPAAPSSRSGKPRG